jgi:hypothetical protein
MKIEDIDINKQYIDQMGCIITMDRNGVLWLNDGYNRWEISKFIKERQDEIFNSLIER